MTDKESVQFEIINAFDKDLGRKLLDAGYISLSDLMDAADEQLLAINGIGPALLEKIREVVSLASRTPESTEIIDSFGDDLGSRLREAGFSSLTELMETSDKQIISLMKDFDSSELEKIRSVAPWRVEPDELEAEAEIDTKVEATDEKSEAADEVAEITEPETEEGEHKKGDSETLVAEAMGELTTFESVETGFPGLPSGVRKSPDKKPYDPPHDYVPSETVPDIPVYSVRVQRIMDENTRVEAERARRVEIEERVAMGLDDSLPEIEAEPASPEVEGTSEVDLETKATIEIMGPFATLNIPAGVPFPAEALIDMEGGGIAEIVAGEKVPEDQEAEGGGLLLIEVDSEGKQVGETVKVDIPETVDEVTAETEELGPEEVGGPDPDDRLAPENYPGEGEEKVVDEDAKRDEESAKLETGDEKGTPDESEAESLKEETPKETEKADTGDEVVEAENPTGGE